MNFAAYNRLRVPVTASDREVVRAARNKLMPEARRDHSLRANRHMYYRAMLDHHWDARDLVEFARFDVGAM